MANTYLLRKRTILIMFFVQFCLKAVLSQTNIGGKCNSPDEYSGTCVELSKCENLSALRFKIPQNHFDRLYVSLSQCGITRNNQPIVCCTESPFPLRSISGTPTTKPQIVPTTVVMNQEQNSQCSVPLDNRILGGRETGIKEMPFTALLAYAKNSAASRGVNFGFFCGGALISKNSILTAAHCVDEKVLSSKGWQLKGARLGEWNLRTNPDCDENICAPSARDSAVSRVIVHENFIPLKESQNHDIAILVLRLAVEFNDFVKPICLPEATSKNFDGVPLTVAGFGKTEKDDNSEIKLKTEVHGISNDECKAMYKDDQKEIFPSQLCALGEEGNDSCNGDSGQPLIHVNSKTSPARYELVGIVSYGPSPCGQLTKPGVYTRVESFLPWILQNMS